MKTLVLSLGLLTVFSFSPVMNGYEVGDEARDFNLKNVDGKNISLKKNSGENGAIVIFTCNTCPYSVLYEDRIIALQEKYEEKGFPVIAIQPNDSKKSPGDSFEKMQQRAEEKGFNFPYVIDETQEITTTYGATNTPHVYLLNKKEDKFYVAYIGAIDNNSRNASKVTEKYLENAVDALLKGEKVQNTKTKAIGCTIKFK